MLSSLNVDIFFIWKERGSRSAAGENPSWPTIFNMSKRNEGRAKDETFPFFIFPFQHHLQINMQWWKSNKMTSPAYPFLPFPSLLTQLDKWRKDSNPLSLAFSNPPPSNFLAVLSLLSNEASTCVISL